MKILIFGGSGILSLDVLKECLKRNYTLTCITRGNRDYRLPDGVKIIHGDINYLGDILPQLENSYDAVLDFLSFDVQGLKNKLDHISSRCSQYIFVSSSVAYSFDDVVITENTRLGNDYWDYGSNKVRCESFIKEHADDYGIKYTIIRPYITYGKTRIPFGIIPVSGEYWSLANRIINHKPILMWDNGQAKCTLTHTEDFAKGFVDLIGNDKSFNEAYHITSGEVLTWKNVLDTIGNVLKTTPIIFSAPTEKIIQVLPEYKGVLEGDKARDRIFDNSKIKSVAPTFKNMKPFQIGIAETIQNYLNNPIERTIDYEWDGRIDRAILKLARSLNYKIDKEELKFASTENEKKVENKVSYICGRYPLTRRLLKLFLKLIHAIKKAEKGIGRCYKKIRAKSKKNTFNNESECLLHQLHHIGINCTIEECDLGQDMKLISIGNHVHIGKGSILLNYRPSAEFFDQVFYNEKHKTIRDLGHITIMDNVFIGKNVTIFPNVKIGSNSLILDGSVVTESIPENAVVLGNPAKPIANIHDWFSDLLKRNEEYPWYGKEIIHDLIVKEREKYFFKE